MNLSKLSACFIILPLLAACSHETATENARTAPSPPALESAPVSTPSGSDEESGPSALNDAPRTAPPPASAPSVGADSAAAAPRGGRGASAYEPQEKKAEDRPGLGTTWGETRTSYVSSERFTRADPSHPFALVSLNYNDEAGIQAMARRMGNSYASFDQSGVDAAQGAVSVRLLDESGSPLPSANFGNRDYVAGSDGERYVIQIENHTGNRFEAVATVDGLDVLDGQGGSLTKRGYLVNAWSTLEIDGFRRSQAAVAAFRFGAVKDSYAARKGSDRNVGVIGVAFFHEQGTSFPWTERELQRRDSANPFPGGFAAPPPVPMAR
jgi:hypothetical protein